MAHVGRRSTLVLSIAGGAVSRKVGFTQTRKGSPSLGYIDSIELL
jgi:hypothetical protein